MKKLKYLLLIPCLLIGHFAFAQTSPVTLQWRALTTQTGHNDPLIFNYTGKVGGPDSIYTKYYIDHFVKSLIPTNGTQLIAPDSIGIGGDLTQDTFLNLGQHEFFVGDTHSDSVFFALSNHDKYLRSRVQGRLSESNHYVYGDSQLLETHSLSGRQSYVEIDTSAIELGSLNPVGNGYDLTLNHVTGSAIFTDDLRHKGIEYTGDYSGQFTDNSLISRKASIMIADSVFTTGIGGALLNGATQTLTAPTIINTGASTVFEVNGGTGSGNESSLIVAPSAAGLNNQVSSTVGYGVSTVTSGPFTGANLGYENPSNSADISTIQIDENHMYIKDTHKKVGLLNNAAMNFVGGEQLMSFRQLDSIYTARTGSAGYEVTANKAISFSTLNNTLYPTTQAVANYVSGLGYLTSATAASTYTPLSRTLIAGNGINAIGDLSSNRTISADTSILAPKNYVNNFASKAYAALTYTPQTRTIAGFSLGSNVTLATQTYGYGFLSGSYNGSSISTPALDSALRIKFGGLGIGMPIPTGTNFASSLGTKALAQNLNSPSGENVFLQTAPNGIIEAQSGGTGTDFSHTGAVVGIPWTSSSTPAAFVQGFQLQIKTSGTITPLSTVTVALYADNGSGVPTGAAMSSQSWFASQMTSSYKAFNFLYQNVSPTTIAPSTKYWAIITFVEQGGGHFVLNSQVGTGTTQQGATLTTMSEANVQVKNIVFARSAYAIHAYAQSTYTAWLGSSTGVALRVDDSAHYSVFGTNIEGHVFGGFTQDGYAFTGSSNSNNAINVSTNSTAGYAAILAKGQIAFLAQGEIQETQPALGITNTAVLLTQGNHTSGTATGFSYVAGTLTGQTASTEINDFKINLSAPVTLATGALTTERAAYILPRTYNFAAASTITTASTLDVGSPVAGTNATITNNYAGNFHGNLNVDNNINAASIAITGTRLNSTTLVAGTSAISITGVTTSSKAFVTRTVASGASLTTGVTAVCTSGTLTITADVAAGTINTADTSTYNYFVIN